MKRDISEKVSLPMFWRKWFQTQCYLCSMYIGVLLMTTAGPGNTAPLTVQIPIGAIFLSDGGLGDLDPTDGVIRFDETVDDSARASGTGAGIRRFEGRALYVPGSPYVSGGGLPGQTNFGAILTDFTMTSLEGPTNFTPPCFLGVEFGNDPLCTDNSRPITTFGQMDIFVQGLFSPGIAADDLGFVSTGLAGNVTTDAPRVFLADLGSWAGDPVVSSGHIVPVVNPNAPNLSPVNFDFGTINSPLASGALNVETVTYQLLTYYIPPDGEGKLRLPDSGSAIVHTIPEPTSLALFVTGFVILGVRRCRRKGA